MSTEEANTNNNPQEFSDLQGIEQEVREAQAQLDAARAKLEELKEKGKVASSSDASSASDAAAATDSTQYYTAPPPPASEPATSEPSQQNYYWQQNAQQYTQPPDGQMPHNSYQTPGQSYQQPPTSGYQPTSQAYSQPTPKDRIAAGLLGIFLGWLGIHKFYLGYTNAGLIMLGITLLGSFLTVGLAAAVMSIIGIIEGIMYLTKSQYEFEQTYVIGERQWF